MLYTHGMGWTSKYSKHMNNNKNDNDNNNVDIWNETLCFLFRRHVINYLVLVLYYRSLAL